MDRRYEGRRCGSLPAGIGNMALHNYCDYCGRNLCPRCMKNHQCSNMKRAGAKRGQGAAKENEQTIVKYLKLRGIVE